MTETPGTPRRPARRVRRGLAGAGLLLAVAVAAPAIAGAAGIDLADSIAVALRSSDARDEPSDVCVGRCGDPGSPAASRSATPESPRAAAAPPSGADVVSTVAACAPRGQDPLFEITGDLRTHGDFVAAAAAGDTLALPFGSYDLATASGATSLCLALDAQRATRSDASAGPGTRREPTAKPSPSPKPRRESPAPRPSADRRRAEGPSPKADRTASQARPSSRGSANPRPSKSR